MTLSMPPTPPTSDTLGAGGILGVILLAEILDLLDSTIIMWPAPRSRDLGGAVSTIQWIAAGYTWPSASAGDRRAARRPLGRRRMFIIGATGSPRCQSPVRWRGPGDADQLPGAAGCARRDAAAQGLGVMRAVFPVNELGKAFSTFGPVIGWPRSAGRFVRRRPDRLDAGAPAGG